MTFRPLRVLSALACAAGTFVGWAAFRIAVEDWRIAAAALGIQPGMTIFGELLSEKTPRPQNSVARAKAWIVENKEPLEFGLVMLGSVLALRELARAIGLCTIPGGPSASGLGGRIARNACNLDAPLLKWTASDAWTVRNAFEGCLVLGATGSGKSSGSGRSLALAMLGAGWGGLVLTVKADERRVWEGYCRAAGRSKDLIVFSPDGPWRFNPLNHDLVRSGAGAGLTENVVHLLSTILEISDRHGSSGGGRDEEGYWRRANLQLMRNLVDLLSVAKGRITVGELYQLVVSAPQSLDDVRSPQWRGRSFCFECLTEADQRAKSAQQQADFALVADYFCSEFPALSEKTRSIVVSTFTSTVDVLNRGLLRELLCTTTNVTPEAIQEGRIVLVDLPVKEFGAVGTMAQVIWKYAFQRAIERRNVAQSPRPAFWFADEAQNFVTSYDMQFQTTCRSARVATVLLSQNVSNFYAALGGNEKGRAEATSLFANLNTKVFHANGDPQSNEWAAGLISRTRVLLASGNQSRPEGDLFSALTGWGEQGQTSSGFSETFEFEVQPSEFSALRTGGPANRGVVDAIVFQSGRAFAGSGRTWLPVSFQQPPSR